LENAHIIANRTEECDVISTFAGNGGLQIKSIYGERGKMKLLLDSNLIYYLAGVSNIYCIDKEKIENELHKYEIYISQWTLVEIISNDEVSEPNKESMLKYIEEKKIESISIEGTDFFSSMPKTLDEFIHNPEKEEIIKLVLIGKKECEASLIAYYIKAAAGVYLSALYYQIESDGGKYKDNYMYSNIHLLWANDDFINKIFARRTLSALQAARYYGRACTPLRGGRKNWKTSCHDMTRSSVFLQPRQASGY